MLWSDKHISIRRLIWIPVLLAFSCLPNQHLLSQDLRDISNNEFTSGEKIKYRVFYDSWLTSWITAGYGTMTVSETDRKFNDRETYLVEVKGKSAGPFNLFYKVDDRFQSYVDKQALVPWLFIRHTREGKFRLDDEVQFDQFGHTARSKKAEKKVPPYVQDIVSAFYYVRTLDFETAEEGDEYFLNFFLDDSVYASRIIFLGREKVKTRLGTFNCLKFKPQVASGGIFQEAYPMVLWVTDDRNKIPVLGKSGVYIGSITIELIEYSGLIHPLKPDEP